MEAPRVYDPSKDRNILVRAAGYENVVQDLRIIRPYNSPHCILDDLFMEPAEPSRQKPGKLLTLPSEILWEIFSSLDVQSCLRLMKTSRLMRDHVLSWIPLIILFCYAKESVQAIMRVRLGNDITVTKLFAALQKQKCALCSQFGGLLFLPKMMRCCYRCIESKNKRLSVVKLESVAQALSVDEEDLEPHLKIMHTIPGSYTSYMNIYRKTELVVCQDQAARIIRDLVDDRTASLISSLPGRSTLMSCLVAVPFPHYDEESNMVNRGISCKGCFLAGQAMEATKRDIRKADRRYNRKAFVKHIRRCNRALDIAFGLTRNVDPTEDFPYMAHDQDQRAWADAVDSEGEGDIWIEPDLEMPEGPAQDTASDEGYFEEQLSQEEDGVVAFPANPPPAGLFTPEDMFGNDYDESGDDTNLSSEGESDAETRYTGSAAGSGGEDEDI